MDFSIPERMQDILAAIRELMEREVYPLEPALLSKPFSELVPELRAIRQKVKALGPLGSADPQVAWRAGAQLRGVRPGRRGARPQPAGPLRRQRPGTRRRQHGDPPRVRHRRAAGALADAPGAGRGPQLLRHDRARSSRLQPGLDGDHGGARRRRLRDQRPQVVRLGGRRSQLRHRDGRDRPRRRSLPPRQPDRRPHRHTRLPPRAQHLLHGARRRRLGQPRRAGLRRMPGPAREPARRGGGRLRDGPGPARARANPAHDALDRGLPARARA